MKWTLDQNRCVELSDTEFGQCIVVTVDQQPIVKIDAHRDQWGTWITFQVGESEATIAQEDGTVSFIDSLIAALTQFKGITDIETKPPIIDT